MTADISRRAALAGLASLSALAAPAAFACATSAIETADGDPAFAAIEKHKATLVAFETTFDNDSDDLSTEDEQAIWTRLDIAERNAMFELADTVPTTQNGAYAALHYLVKVAGDQHYKVLGIFGASLIEAKWAPPAADGRAAR